MKVEVVGTQFNVMAYENEEVVRTTLVEGVVKSSVVGQQKSKDLMLRPGEQAVLNHKSGVMDVEKASINEVIGWRSWEFVFHDANVATIMRQVERWYNVTVEYRGSVADIVLSGQISKEKTIEELLGVLSETRKVHFEIKDKNTVIVIPGPK